MFGLVPSVFNPLDLVRLVIPLITGIILGYLLQNKRRMNLGKITFGVIIALIFSLGFSIGSNNALLNSLPSVGVYAIVILALVLLFSVLFVKVVRKLVKID
jgi:uncharacterized membrane protein YbjE (DUF340 family)